MLLKGLKDTLYQRQENLYGVVYANREDTIIPLDLKLKGHLKLVLGKENL